jgi:hypothetical protein
MNYSYFHRFSLARLLSAGLFFGLLLTANSAFYRNFAQTRTQSPPVAGKTQTVDRTRLEVIEELSESLANDLLELSVATRDLDFELTSEFFPARITGKIFPSSPQTTGSQVKWIGNHGWELSSKGVVRSASNNSGDAAGNKITKKEFLESWKEFLSHFSEIEDARFKVKEANFDEKAQAVMDAEQPTAVVGATGKARIAFYVIGRDTDGRREWARGTFIATVRAAPNKHWQFDSIELVGMDSLVANTDLFSEVAVPADVSTNLPSFGTPENSGFVWNGAAAADFNNDGWIDLFVISEHRNFLYLNDGKGKFRDISDQTGVKILSRGSAPLVFDYDNDGDSDIFISAVGQQILLENTFKQNGKLEFNNVSLESGVAKNAVGFSAVAGDVNGDGFLDIYVTSYNHYGRITPDSWFRATNGTPNLLFISQGNGTFREEAAK